MTPPPREQKLLANIRISYALRFIQGAWLPLSTALLFYQSNGLDLDDVFLLKAVSSVAAMFLEVPTGYFADRFGRKRSLLIAGACAAISPLIYFVSADLPSFLIAELFLAIGVTFMSGADSALVYDSLSALGRAEEYGRIESRMSAVTAASEGVCALLGGFLASIELRFPFAVQCGLYAVFVLLAAGLYEPLDGTAVARKKIDLVSVMRFTLAPGTPLRYLALLSAWSGAGTFFIVWFSQAFLESIRLPVVYFGVAWAAYHLCLSLASIVAPRIRERLSRTAVLCGLAVLLSAGYLGLAFSRSLWGIGFILILYVVRGIRVPLVRAWINELVDGERRATALSTVNFLFRLTFVAAGPLLGKCAQAFSLRETFMIIAVVWLLPPLYWIARLKRAENRTASPERRLS